MREIRALEAHAEAEATEVEAREAARQADTAAAAARQVTEIERDKVLHQIRIAEEQRRAKATADATSLEAERARIEAFQRQSVLQVEHERVLGLQRQAGETELARLRTEIALEVRQREADAREHENQLDAAHQRRLGELERELAQVRARHALVEGLPQIALALRQQVGVAQRHADRRRREPAGRGAGRGRAAARAREELRARRRMNCSG